VLCEAHDVALYLRDLEQALTWMTLRESMLNTRDLGSSPEEAEALLKKQDDFEKSLAAQERAFRQLQQRTPVSKACVLESKKFF
jgi:hypothetical protein